MSRRLVKVNVTQDLFRQWLTLGFEIGARPGITITCTTGLPEGADLVGSFMDCDQFCVSLVFCHPSFADVPEGQPIPELMPIWTQERITVDG